MHGLFFNTFLVLLISEQTLYKWAAKYSEFGEALKKTKEITVYEVENAMFKSALGYYVEETKITDSDKDGHKEEKIRKYIPPNVTAQIFWLKNKAPDEWQERRDIMLDTSNGVLDSILELRKDAKGDME